jgi:smad nuclear-interacting protein 1
MVIFYVHLAQFLKTTFGFCRQVSDIIFLALLFNCSSQHAVIQYRALPNKTTGKLQCLPYLIDLESTNGCFINGVRIDAARYYQLKKGDVLRFGASTREYVLMAETASSLK